MKTMLRTVLMACVCMVFAVSGYGATLTVPTDYPTIQSAINAAQAGDTVYVQAGSYSEALTFKSRIRLVGESADSVVLSSPSWYVIEAINCESGSVENVTLNKSGGFS